MSAMQMILEKTKLAQMLKDNHPDLKIHCVIAGTWLWVDGEVEPIKDELVSHGFKFSKNKNKWYSAGLIKKRAKKVQPWSYIEKRYEPEEV